LKTIGDAKAIAENTARNTATEVAKEVPKEVAIDAANKAATQAATAGVRQIMQDPHVQQLVNDTAAQLFREGAYRQIVEKAVHAQMQSAISEGMVGGYVVSINGVPNQGMRIDKKLPEK
jgi:Zn-dependent alcohol dehydrogenase